MVGVLIQLLYVLYLSDIALDTLPTGQLTLKFLKAFDYNYCMVAHLPFAKGELNRSFLRHLKGE